ncbi:hypothetical protein PMA3_15025 [Pseudomonas silesiensis]|jgi:hypothetical protein|uniref:Uncharacterized protein n=1 Tax=Pseudomonas silesiensis TaxID=1853130 RepID=A0A191YUC0_9PSED|nr:hypothetical protein PMA3_15025 [Pseudomonas silesiensis]
MNVVLLIVDVEIFDEAEVNHEMVWRPMPRYKSVIQLAAKLDTKIRGSSGAYRKPGSQDNLQ